MQPDKLHYGQHYTQYDMQFKITHRSQTKGEKKCTSLFISKGSDDLLQTQLEAHLNLRGSTVPNSTYSFNSSLMTKRPWISGLTYRGACRGSTLLHIVLTFIRTRYESESDFPEGGSPEIGAPLSVFFRGSPQKQGGTPSLFLLLI